MIVFGGWIICYLGNAATHGNLILGPRQIVYRSMKALHDSRRLALSMIHAEAKICHLDERVSNTQRPYSLLVLHNREPQISGYK